MAWAKVLVHNHHFHHTNGMVGRALSIRVKKQKQRRNENTKYQTAVADYKQGQLKPGKKPGYRLIAKKHNIKASTLRRLVLGGTSMSAFNASKQLLSEAEERVIVNFILESADRGIPLASSAIRACADAIIEKRSSDGHLTGECWVDRFIGRHSDELQTHWSRPLDTQRARALNPGIVKHWFQIVKKELVDKGFVPENIYGMDESGFPPSNQGRE